MADLSTTNQDNILIVDDVPDNLELLSRILTKRGYAVRSVESGRQAIAIAKSGWADLILLDITMPEMDGYEICRHLKADPDTNAIPIIFLSALDRIGDKVNAFSVGGVDYITKPFQIKEVVARVRTHLQLRNLQKNLEFQVASRTSELATALQKAEAANSAKNIFFSQITHELRTPMNAVLGFVQLMQRDNSLTQEQQEHLKIISHSGEHLMALINDVLEVSKIEAGHSILDRSNFDFYQMLKGIEEMLSLQAKARNLKFTIEQDSFTPRYIKTDRKKLRQILINLLINAVKFTKEGQISLRIGYNPQKPYQLSFEVQDTGYGITSEELNTLFDPFVQTEAGRKSDSGTGLGLSISRHYVQLMGGDIKVCSQINQGSTFSFDIQIELGQPTAQCQKMPRVIGLQSNQSIPKVLVVEDRRQNRQFLSRLLEIVGFEVREAVNGEEAISIWADWSPQLILMDLQMPIMDGYEATQYIKRQDKSVVIIATTGSSFREQKQFIFASGCDDLINIPFQESDLWSKIATHLQIKYIYEKISDPVVVSDELEWDIENISLSFMPIQWIEQLSYFATAANSKEILSLLEEIPKEQADLSIAISQLVNDFCFEQIIDLAEIAMVEQ